MNPKRVTRQYIEGTSHKIPGVSEILNGDRISKSDSSCNIHSSTEKLRIAVLNFKQTFNQKNLHLESDLDSFLDFLLNLTFSLSAFCFMKGNTDFFLTKEALEEKIAFCQTNIEHFKNQIPNDSEFNYSEEVSYISIEILRNCVRDLEREYIAWMYSIRVVQDLYSHLLIDSSKGLIRFEEMIYTSRLLNILSSYFYWLNVYLHAPSMEVWEEV